MWGLGKRKRSLGSQQHSGQGGSAGAGRRSRSSLIRLAVFALAAVIAASAALLVASSSNSALSGAPLPASVGLSGWDTTSNSWTHGNTVQYAEKQAIPFQLDLGGLSTSTSYLVNICREFQNGTKYGFLYLEKYNKTVALTDTQAGGTVVDAAGPFSTINATV